MTREETLEAMRVYGRLLAYVEEFAPDYVPEWSHREGANGCVYYSHTRKKWDSSFSTVNQDLGAVYMPMEVAKELARKLNSGEVVL